MPSELNGLRALVTGGRGFLGQHLINCLLERGAEVFGTSRTPPSEPSSVHWHTGVFDSGEAIDGLLADSKPDVVYHFAGAVSGSPDLSHLIPTFHSLLESSMHLLHRASDNGPRVVLAGSFLEPRSGDPSTVVGSPYAAAKQAMRIYADMCVALYGAPVVQTVPFMVYGPGQNTEKLLPYVIRSLLNGQAPELSDGSQRADWVYVGDVADALVTCGIEPRALGQHIDLGTGEITSMRAVVERVAERIGGPAPQFGAQASRPNEPTRRANLVPARDILGWTASTSLDEGLERTIASLRGSH